MTIHQEDKAGRLALRLDELQLPLLDAYLSPRAFSWLGDHQDEAAELAALLHEAAPRLALASLRAPPVGSGGRAQGLPKARSYEVSDTIRDRLHAAVPMPTGPGQIDWSSLTAIISSEMLKFDEASDAALLARLQSLPAGTGVPADAGSPAATAAAAVAAATRSASGTRDSSFTTPSTAPAAVASPRATSGGDLVEINSGGRVIFCLFALEPPRAPTPPCSLRSSPDKGVLRFAGRAGQLAESARLDLGPAAAVMVANHPSLLLQEAEEPPPTPDGWRAGQAPNACGTSGGSAADSGGRELVGEPSLRAPSVQSSSSSGDGAQAAAAHDSRETCSQEQAGVRLQADAVAQQHGRQRGNGDDSCSQECPSGSCPEARSLGGVVRAALQAQEHRGSFSFPGSPPGAAGGAVEAGSGPGPLRHVSLRGGGAALPCAPGPEGCLILKFVGSRLLCQSEQFAAELTRHVGLCTPDSRILRQKGATEQEWGAAYEAASALKGRFPDLHEEMTRSSCCLVMEYIPGGCLFKQPAAFAGERLQRTAEDLGRLFTLDMLLGNADRLHCRELGWRGNPENIIYATAGRWAGRAVAIDAVVQRRPPGGLMSVEDSCCERLTELALNDAEVAGSLLRQALRPCIDACGPWEPARLRDSAAAFQRGLKAALDAAVTIKGLLEMMFDVTAGWIDSFLEDIEADDGSSSGGHATPGGPPATTPRSVSSSRRVSSAGGVASPLLAAAASTTAQTMRIRQINHEAQRNDSVGEKVSHWKGLFREKGEELRAAVEEWQAKRGTAAAGVQRLTTAFLDGVYPIVDVYELKVRLEHMLQRLRVLQQATLTGRPCRLMARLYLSGAVEASSHHLLRHLGITHILNATEDLLLPGEEQGFVTLRCPLRDVEEEDISPHLPGASAFIDEGLASGGAVLVHCHAGKSRSCSLVLAWLMTRRRWPLNRAMDFLRRMRPEAAPNAGYLAALLRLEEGLFGRQTVKMKKTKPEPRSCPVCGDKVGLSADSVRVHLRLKHPGALLARSGQSGSQDGSGSWAELLDSPAGSSPRSLGMQMSPRSGGMPASPRPSALQQQQQQQQQPAAASPAFPGGFDHHEPLTMPAAPPVGVAAIRTSRQQGAALTSSAEAAAAALPDSPPMAAVLQTAGTVADLVEEGQLIGADSGVEEFLRTADVEMGA